MRFLEPVLRSIPKPVVDRLRKVPRFAVEHGLHPVRVGYRHVEREKVAEHVARGGASAGRIETVHPPAIAHNPLPQNVTDRRSLPADRGWWGYSFRDVPERESGETAVVTLRDVLVTWYRDPERGDDFYPALLSKDGRGLNLREIEFRPKHGVTLRRSGRPARVERATWVVERVYDNHSHWITAHLPKFVLLRERGMLGDVLLPPASERTETMDCSLRMLGIDPEEFRSFDPSRPLRVDELTVLVTDRFRPELLQGVQRAFADAAVEPHRRVYISRARASRRRLANEEAVWPVLERLGFERVFMEDLPFKEQVNLMRETAVLAAPHGAGLTNMAFCSSGTRVVEIADLGFPNPNFYALASALGHPYWIVQADSVGGGHPLSKDLRVGPDVLEGALREAVGGTPGGTLSTQTTSI